ncbi:hypothetical protein B0H13DRAFT_2282184 [Mycena leptocephala]|nr:hypothetical protein B0H13DRAFT_2282184 [Mycena leptocephala]
MNFSLSYPRLKLAVPPTLVRVDLPAQVHSRLAVYFKSSGLRAGRLDVLSDAQHDPPTWRSLPYKTPNSSLKTQLSPSSPSSPWARVLKFQAISVIEFHSRLAYYRATDYQRYCSEEWGCARWGDDGRACAQCSTGARELRQVVQKYGHRLGIIARGLTSTREKGIGRAAWRGRGRREEGGGEGCKEVPPKKAAPCRVDVHGPEKRGREQGSRSREGKEVREGGGPRLGRGWDAPTLARVGVDAGIARAAGVATRASAVRRGYCELARIRRRIGVNDAPSGMGGDGGERCGRGGRRAWGCEDRKGSAEGGGMGAGEGRGWNGMGGETGTWRQSWEPRTRARSSVVVEVGGGVCGDTGRRQRGGGWDMRRGASTTIHRCSRGEGDGGVKAGREGRAGQGAARVCQDRQARGEDAAGRVRQYRRAGRGHRGGEGRDGCAELTQGKAGEMGVATDGRKAKGGFRAGRGHSGEG